MGMASAQNDTADTVSYNAWFRMEGSASTSNLVVETDDDTTNNDDNATGTTLSTVYKRMLVDLSQGLSDVRFFVDGARVGSTETYSLRRSAAAGQNVQPFVQIQKASGTGHSDRVPGPVGDHVQVVLRRVVSCVGEPFRSGAGWRGLAGPLFCWW